MENSLKKEKELLEDRIFDAISRFEEITELDVTQVEIIPERTDGEKKVRIIAKLS